MVFDVFATEAFVASAVELSTATESDKISYSSKTSVRLL